MSKNKSNEYNLHVKTVDHIRSCFIGHINPWLDFWHTPNQTRNKTEAFFNKKMGVKLGAPDLIFSWPIQIPSLGKSGVHMGLVELKYGKTPLTPEQKEFRRWADIIGWHTAEARSVREVHDALLQWGHKARYDHVPEPCYLDKSERFQAVFEAFKPT